MKSKADKDLFTNFINLCQYTNKVEPEAVIKLQTECLNLPENSYIVMEANHNPARFLFKFFIWAMTSDGDGYWRGIHDKLRNLHNEEKSNEISS